MATTTPAAKQPAKATAAQKFDPIAARDRIKAIEVGKAEAIARYDAEKAALIAKLVDEGFALIGEKQAITEDMSDPENWKKGDIVKCIDRNDWHFITLGKEYELTRSGVDSDGEISTRDDDGDPTSRDAECFVFVRRP